MLHFSLNPLHALVYRFLFNVSLNICCTLEAPGSKADSIWIKVGRTHCTSLLQFNPSPAGLESKRGLWEKALPTSSIALTNHKSTSMYSMKGHIWAETGDIKASSNVLQCKAQLHDSDEGTDIRNRRNKHSLMSLALTLLVLPCTAWAEIWRQGQTKTRVSWDVALILSGVQPKPWQGYQQVSATWYQKTPHCLLGPAFSHSTLHLVPDRKQPKTTSTHVPSTSPCLSLCLTVSARSWIWNALSFSCDLKWTKQMPFMPLNIVSLAGCSPNSDMENKFCRLQEHSIECKSLLHCYSAYLKRRSEIAAVFSSFRGWSVGEIRHRKEPGVLLISLHPG